MQPRAAGCVVDAQADAVELHAAAVDRASNVVRRAAAVDVFAIGDDQQNAIASVTRDAIEMSGGEGHGIEQGRAGLRSNGFDRIAQVIVVRGQVLLEDEIVAERQNESLVVLAEMPHHVGERVGDAATVLAVIDGSLHQYAE